MYECKHIRDVSFSSIDVMGNVFATAMFSGPRELASLHSQPKTPPPSPATFKPITIPVKEEDVVVWSANIDDIDSVAEDSPLIMSLLPAEKQKVKKFLFPDDQKRALLSILLQRALIRERYNITDSDYEIRRTREVRNFYVLSSSF